MFATRSLNLNTENADAILRILIVYKWKIFLIEWIVGFPYHVSEGIDNFLYSHLKIYCCQHANCFPLGIGISAMV